MDGQQYPPRLGDFQPIFDLPLVCQHMHNLATSCVCNSCHGESIPAHYAKHESWECKKKEFLSSILLCAADILAISLFESPETLLVSLDPYQMPRQFEKAIHDIVKSGQPVFLHHWEILAHALKLVGHKQFDDVGWVISCYKGQAVYPKVFETGNISQPGYLALHWAPGLLFFDGEIYDRGIDPVRHDFDMYNGLETESVVKEWSRSVTEPLNLYPNIRMEWKVARRDGYLEVYPMCERIVGHAPSILLNLTQALVIICPHDKASSLDRPDPNSRYIGPFNFDPFTSSAAYAKGQIGVIAVDGNTDLRMFALSALSGINLELFIVRGNACLQCCLNLCRDAGSRYVIC